MLIPNIICLLTPGYFVKKLLWTRTEELIHIILMNIIVNIQFCVSLYWGCNAFQDVMLPTYQNLSPKMYLMIWTFSNLHRWWRKFLYTCIYCTQLTPFPIPQMHPFLQIMLPHLFTFFSLTEYQCFS